MNQRVRYAIFALAGLLCGGILVSVVPPFNNIKDRFAACNVGRVSIRGDLVTYIPPDSVASSQTPGDMTSSEDVVKQLQSFASNPSIKAILLDIDSPGGSSVAAEEIVTALKDAGLPSVSLVRSEAASAAYWTAVGTDHIVAPATSDVGSIGVTLSYLEDAANNAKNDLTYQEITSAPFKNIGDPNSHLTEAERAILQSEVDAVHKIFVDAVATHRKLDVAKVKKLANGTAVLGEEAAKDGLIDEVGGIDEAKAYLKNVIGSDPKFCE